MRNITTFIATLLLSLTMVAQNTITTDSILQTSTCAGGNVLVPFTATGSYVFGNEFVAQLSNQFGQFVSPVNIGQTPINTGVIIATIPQSTNFGILYKIRVISTNPAVIGSECPNNLVITQVAELNEINASPNDTVCQGDSITLSAINPASSYQWSTGDTTQSIIVSMAGTYSVITTDYASCESETSIDITVEICTNINEKELKHSLVIYPNPTSGQFTIDNSQIVITEMLITDILGKTIITKSNLKDEKTFDLSNFENGIYIVHIKTEKNNFITKIVKKQ